MKLKVESILSFKDLREVQATHERSFHNFYGRLNASQKEPKYNVPLINLNSPHGISIF